MSKSQSEFPSPKKLCRALHSDQITEKALPEGSVDLGDLYLVEAGLDPVEVPAHPVHGETLGRAQPRVDHAPDVGEAVPGHLASVDPANKGMKE